MDNVCDMDYTLMSSLEYEALTQIAVMLWYNSDSRYLAAEISRISGIGERKSEWAKVEHDVIKKANKLPLPELLKKKLLSFVTGVGWEIMLWLDFHENRCNFVTGLPSKFFWTARGTIDKKKTAELLIQDESLDILKRYTIACIYCLDQHINALWDELSSNQLCPEGLDMWQINQQPLVTFWTQRVNEKHETPAAYKYIFQRSAFSGNEVAIRYFYEKLTTDEKEEILVRTAEFVAKKSGRFTQRTDFPREHHAGALCFLLTVMNEEQQKELYRLCPLEVLICLLEWSWQEVFTKVARNMSVLLSKEHYNMLFKVIKSKIAAGHKDNKYCKLFGDFCQQIPPSCNRN